MRSVLKSLYLKAFPVFERLGIHITPVHHTQPVPDTRDLGPRIWSEPSELVGIDMREAEQLRLLESFVARLKHEYGAMPRRPRSEGPPRFYMENPFFGPVDAEILHCMIRTEKPKRIIEIGSGFSTLLAKEALELNARDGFPGRLDSYDPAPAGVLASVAGERVSINVSRAEDIPFDTFEQLGPGDILFIDSTHVVRIGGDVCYEILEVVPRLRDGVLVHFHDIFMPAQYPKDWVLRQRFFWTEQYLLQAFLAFNDAFAVLWGSSFMHARHPQKIAAAFASFDPKSNHTGGSFWIRRGA
ncbi:MAG: class I SAM-dependent methyltransferase [Candidatus Eremiobacterales bacterium]